MKSDSKVSPKISDISPISKSYASIAAGAKKQEDEVEIEISAEEPDKSSERRYSDGAIMNADACNFPAMPSRVSTDNRSCSSSGDIHNVATVPSRSQSHSSIATVKDKKMLPKSASEPPVNISSPKDKPKTSQQQSQPPTRVSPPKASHETPAEQQKSDVNNTAQHYLHPVPGVEFASNVPPLPRNSLDLSFFYDPEFKASCGPNGINAELVPGLVRNSVLEFEAFTPKKDEKSILDYVGPEPKEDGTTSQAAAEASQTTAESAQPEFVREVPDAMPQQQPAAAAEQPQGPAVAAEQPQEAAVAAIKRPAPPRDQDPNFQSCFPNHSDFVQMFSECK